MKITVDATCCTGHGRCYSLAPQLLESDEDGYVTIKGSTLDVPVGQEDAAERARNGCPEDAITLSSE